MKKQEKRIFEAVKFMKNYVGTYDNQQYYLEYSDEIFIDDMLYGIGVALEPQKHKMADGYYRFLQTLKKHIDEYLEFHKEIRRVVEEDGGPGRGKE